MALIGRVARLLRADLHALLDQLEEPETLLRQAIREMEEILATDRARCKQLLREQALLEEREQEVRQSLSSCESELDLCFEHGREALARDLIRRRLEAAELLKAMSAKHSRVVKSCGELTAAIEQNHSRLATIRQKADLLATEKFEESADDCRHSLDSRVLDQQVELELLREKQKRGAA